MSWVQAAPGKSSRGIGPERGMGVNTVTCARNRLTPAGLAVGLKEPGTAICFWRARIRFSPYVKAKGLKEPTVAGKTEAAKQVPMRLAAGSPGPRAR